MSDVIKLKKGLDIRLTGESKTVYAQVALPELFAIKPGDFHGLMPKLDIKVGDTVQAGGILFHDKNRPEVKFVSPVSGEVVAINRGERRVIQEVVVKSDGKIAPANVGKCDTGSMTGKQVVEKLLETGTWAYFKQRPYNIVADPNVVPKAIFISSFDTAPLAPDYDFIVNGNEKFFQAGLDALAKIAPVRIGYTEGASKAFSNAQNAKTTKFVGPHPAGCVGVQINHTEPINAGEKVFTIQPQEVMAIGKMFETGELDFSRVVVMTGSGLTKQAYVHTVVGAQLGTMLNGNMATDADMRVISGNVLTGTQVTPDGFLGFYDSQITVIPEGNKYEFLGWATPGMGKFSVSRTFFSWLCPKKQYNLDTNMHGEHRAFVVSNELDKVLPMDIYPEFLFKAILAQDIDKMDQLGIYEVVEEDIALCEFVCTSKIALQKVLRNGIDLMLKEVGE